MTDDRQPIDMALDVFFYAPLGLALTAAEEMPKLAEKGRRRFTTQWAAARMVGQFAVAQGRKEAARRFTSPDGTRPPAPAPAPTEAVTEPVAAPDPVPAAGGPTTTPQAATPPATDGAGPAPALPAVDELAIPGYDSLSASQVVQRLAGLSPAELDAVGRYEAGTRGRRTILTRVSQLQEP